MAVDVCSISNVSISPRISFSHDLNDNDPLDSTQTHPIRSDHFLLSPSTFDFDFCTTSTFTPADELFSNGKILPTQIKIPPQTIQKTDTHKKRLKEFVLIHGQENQQQEQEKSTLKSFWQFRRSASLNCDNNAKGPKGLLRSLSIKSLSRSNSTGSALNPKRNSGPKMMEKSKDLRRCSSLSQPPPPPPASSSFSSSHHVYYSYQNSNNSKNCKGGIRIIPILNIPPAYNFSINFFSLFCNGKAKKKTK